MLRSEIKVKETKMVLETQKYLVYYPKNAWNKGFILTDQYER